MGSLRATGEDLLRWRRQGRWDILQWCGVLGRADNPLAVLWIHPDTGLRKTVAHSCVKFLAQTSITAASTTRARRYVATTCPLRQVLFVSDEAEGTLTQCPACNGTGHVPSRLPFRKNLCPECGGIGQVTPTRREQLLQKRPAK